MFLTVHNNKDVHDVQTNRNRLLLTKFEGFSGKGGEAPLGKSSGLLVSIKEYEFSDGI